MLLINTAHRLAAALAVLFLALAVIFGTRYFREHGGWDIRSGSDDLMTLMLLVVGAVCASAVAIVRPGPRNPAGAKVVSLIWSATLVLALLFTLRVIAIGDRWHDDFGTPVHSLQDLDAFIAAHADAFAAYDYQVPTGVYLQSFEFLNANNVEMSGFVWQEYGPEIPDHVVRGVALPEALEESYDAQEAWRVEQDGVEEIGWYFSGQFRQNFDYSLYPFDRQDLWLRIWSPEAVEGVVLVPDFDAYRDLTPRTLPGVDPEFVYGGWDPLDSEFTYGLVDYNTDFGLGYGFSGERDPELYFNIQVARDAFSPMLEHLVLEAAIAVLLFLLLVLMTQRTAERGGLSAFDLIVASGGLLFAVILDHNAIRGTIQSQSLTYLEWYPLILEAYIVLVVLSAVLRVKQWRVPLLGYSGDLVPVLAYWPALLGTLLVVTLLVFFY
ncbi:MAG: hypothetical protein ACRDJC_24765 [Thermomicrobiales bacterium]